MGAFLLYWLTKLLTALFLIGLLGSAIVVIITFFEDGRLLLESDEPRSKPQAKETQGRIVQAPRAV
jgi:cell division protein FtsL